MTRRGERASVLMLVPAGVLIVLMLGAIAFDLSLVFLRQRQAASVAADVANDLASLALDEDGFRRTGDFRLDPERAQQLGVWLAEESDAGPDVLDVEVTVPDDRGPGPATVIVRVTLQVDYVFARAIPGAAEGTTVSAAATAVAESGVGG